MSYLYIDQLYVSVEYPHSWVQEGDSIQVCLQTNWVVTDSVHIHVQTTHTTENKSPAIGKTVIVQRSKYVLIYIFLNSWL